MVPAAAITPPTTTSTPPSAMDKVRRTLVNPGIERASLWKNRTAFDIPWITGVTTGRSVRPRISARFPTCWRKSWN